MEPAKRLSCLLQAMVGFVIVKYGKVISERFHHKAG